MPISAYADDMILMSPTSIGLQKLLNVTSCLLDEEGPVLNVQRTNIVVFKQKSKQPVNLLIQDFWSGNFTMLIFKFFFSSF